MNEGRRRSDVPGKYPSRWDRTMGYQTLRQAVQAGVIVFHQPFFRPPRRLKNRKQNTQKNNNKKKQNKKGISNYKKKKIKKGKEGWGNLLSVDSRYSMPFELHWWYGLTFPRLLTQALAPGVRPSASLFCWDCFHAEGQEREMDFIRTAV